MEEKDYSTLSAKEKEIELNKTVDGFHTELSNVLKIVDAKAPGDIEVDRLKRLIRLARDEDPLYIITRSKDKVWDSRNNILAENEDYFLSTKFEQYIKKDGNQRFIEALLTLVQNGYAAMTPKEKSYMWNINKRILQHVIKYKMLIGDLDMNS